MLTYFEGQEVMLGDKFVAARWGTCVVESFDTLNRCAIARNVCTGEVFDLLGQPTFGEADLLERI